MSEVKLEPCPFCGGEPALEDTDFGNPAWVYFCCKKCAASAGACDTYEKAVAVWNTRAPHPSHAAVEAMAQALEKAEWAEWPDPYCGMQLFCAECRNFKKRGHSKDCAIGTALAAYRATQNKDVRP